MANDKMVYCRVCGAQIASSAKRCPKCGAKQKKGHGFRNFLLLLILIGICYFVYSRGIYKDPLKYINDLKGKKTTTEETSNSQVNEKSDTSNVKQEEKETESKEEVKEDVKAEDNSEVIEEVIENNTDVKEETVSSIDGVTPEFKEFMDSYEAYMNEYCDFMESYDPSDATLLLKYASLIEKAAEFEKVDDFNEDNLSAEDYKYYIDVMARINKRMVDASVAIENPVSVNE